MDNTREGKHRMATKLLFSSFSKSLWAYLAFSLIQHPLHSCLQMVQTQD